MRREAETLHKALNELMSACGFSGEIGTERRLHVPLQAMEDVDDEWDSVVGQSHRDGLCYDVNALLAYKIASITLEEGKSCAEKISSTGRGKWPKRGVIQ